MSNGAPALPAFPHLHTSRCVLREIDDNDLEAMYLGLSDAQVIRYYGVAYDSLKATREQMQWYAQLRAEGRGLWWGIALADQPQALIGACGLYEYSRRHRRAELGYWLSPEHWGQGLMSECVGGVLAYGFEAMVLHRIEAVVEPDNLASIALLERHKFVREGVRRECERRAGQYLSLISYGLLQPEWAGR